VFPSVKTHSVQYLKYQAVYGYPIEIQAFFYMALRCVLLHEQDVECKGFIKQIVKLLHALSSHLRSYFWLDLKQHNYIYHLKTEQYSSIAIAVQQI